MEETSKAKVMSTTKDLGSIPITNELLENALAKLIGWENGAMVYLFKDMLKESPKGAEWFMRLSMGENVPTIPGVGLEVYVSIDRLGWNVDANAYRDSVYNENGFIKCTVKAFRGLHTYHPVVIELPKLDPSDKTSEAPLTHIDIDEWKPADPDFYDLKQVDVLPMPKLYNAIKRYNGKI